MSSLITTEKVCSKPSFRSAIKGYVKHKGRCGGIA